MKRPEEEDPLPFKFNAASNAYKERQQVRESLRKKVNDNIVASGNNAGFLIYGLRETVDRRAKRAALKIRVDTVLASAAQPTPEQRKDYLGSKVRAALSTAAQADPLLDFSCGCEFHQSVVTGPDSLTASIVWAA